MGFNPCEGFGGFATANSRTIVTAIVSFNPCEGFGGFATNHASTRSITGHVSIPVRDSGVLRQLDVDRLLVIHPCFNPCEGFGGFATSKTSLLPLARSLFQSL